MNEDVVIIVLVENAHNHQWLGWIVALKLLN